MHGVQRHEPISGLNYARCAECSPRNGFKKQRITRAWRRKKTPSIPDGHLILNYYKWRLKIRNTGKFVWRLRELFLTLQTVKGVVILVKKEMTEIYKKYRLTSNEEPTDEMLEALMEDVAQAARESSNKAETEKQRRLSEAVHTIAVRRSQRKHVLDD